MATNSVPPVSRDRCSPDKHYIGNLRLGKLACPRVNDDQKVDVGDQNSISGRPHEA